jgi:hypothetical protein
MSHQSRSPVFAGAVVACEVVGAVAGLVAHGAAHAPEYALGSMLVYRCEIGLAVFLILYVGVVFARLAYNGQTPTRIGARGAELPDVKRPDLNLLSDALSESQTVARLLAELPDQVADQLNDLEQRVAILEQSSAAEGDHD